MCIGACIEIVLVMYQSCIRSIMGNGIRVNTDEYQPNTARFGPFRGIRSYVCGNWNQACIRHVLGMYFYSMCSVLRQFHGCITCIIEVFQDFFVDMVLGMYKACIWNILGMYYDVLRCIRVVVAIAV